MRLYHTGKTEIRKPDIYRGRVNADFGQGFYLTSDKEFSHIWAGRDAVINEYELDMTGLKVHRFARDMEWFQYIFANRRAKDNLKADVVMGPVANDTIFDTLGILGSGFLSPEEALSLLMIGPEYMQIAIKSEKALSQLVWDCARTDPDHEKYAKLLKKEQEEYQKRFAEAMMGLG